MVLDGRMGEAIEKTQQLYPGLLDQNKNLLFMLKCRQFIEMVNGTDSEVRGSTLCSPKSQGVHSSRSSPNMSPTHHPHHPSHHPPCAKGKDSGSNSPSQTSSHLSNMHSPHSGSGLNSISEDAMNSHNSAINGNSPGLDGVPLIEDTAYDVMDTSDGEDRLLLNGSSQCVNGSHSPKLEEGGDNDMMGMYEKL